jgi:hypothetical protein
MPHRAAYNRPDAPSCRPGPAPDGPRRRRAVTAGAAVTGAAGPARWAAGSLPAIAGGGDHASSAHVGRPLTITAALTLERGPRLTLPGSGRSHLSRVDPGIREPWVHPHTPKPPSYPEPPRSLIRTWPQIRQPRCRAAPGRLPGGRTLRAGQIPARPHPGHRPRRPARTHRRLMSHRHRIPDHRTANAHRKGRTPSQLGPGGTPAPDHGRRRMRLVPHTPYYYGAGGPLASDPRASRPAIEATVSG